MNYYAYCTFICNAITGNRTCTKNPSRVITQSSACDKMHVIRHWASAICTVYDNAFSARWSDVDLIRKREKTCIGLCTSWLGLLLVYMIKGTTWFTCEYLPCISDYSQAILGILYVHSDLCIPWVLEDNPWIFFEICRGTKDNKSAIVNLAVGCTVATFTMYSKR